MRLDYEQKQKLIEHLSSRDNWRNAFSMAFFMANDRKGASRRVTPSIDRFVNDAGNRVSVSHTSGAELFFEIHKNHVVIRDESGASFLMGPDGPLSDGLSDGVKELPLSRGSNEMAEVTGTCLLVRFDHAGNKFIIRGNHQVEMPAPAADYAKPLQKGAQIHVASIREAAARAWGIPACDLADVTKMVMACDLGLETGIGARNIAQSLVIVPVASGLEGNVTELRPRARHILTLVQKPWSDTTEFEGHDVPLPRNFHLEADGDGVNVITSLDQREAIWSQGDVMRAVLSDSAAPVETVSQSSEARHILSFLGRGHTVQDHRGREWNYLLVKTRDSLTIATKLRNAMRSEFGLTARHCAVLTLDKDICVIAMDSRVVESAQAHSREFYNPETRAAIAQAVERASPDARVVRAAMLPI